MALTMRAVSAELDRLDGRGRRVAGRNELVHALARAALMGARGNSGVILSQIVRGAAEELATPAGRADRPDAGRGRVRARRRRRLRVGARARRGDDADRRPRDGPRGDHAPRPHLRRAAAGSTPRRRAEMQDEMLAEVARGDHAGRRARPSAGRPSSSTSCAEAGVVDAGAHGLVLILAGVVARAARPGRRPWSTSPHQAPARRSVPHHADSRYRYCINFIVSGDGLDSRASSGAAARAGRRLGPGRRRRRDAEGPRPHRRARQARWRSSTATAVVSSVDEADMREQIEARASSGSPTGSRAGVLAVVSGAGLRAALRGARRRAWSTAGRR